MIPFFKRFLHKDDYQTVLLDFIDIVEKDEILKAELNEAAKSYFTSSQNLSNWKSEDAKELVKGQQDSLTTRYLSFLAEKQKAHKILTEKKAKYIAQYPHLQKALEDKKQHDFLVNTLGNYRSGGISLELCDSFLKAVTKEKVHYSDCLIFNEKGQLLIVQASPNDPDKANLWGLPGGHVDPGEDHKTAAIRELREETGYEVDNMEEYGKFDDANCHIEYFKADIKTTEQSPVVDANETRMTEFVELKDLYKYPTHHDIWDKILQMFSIGNKTVTVIKSLGTGFVKNAVVEKWVTDEITKAIESDKKKRKVKKVMDKWKEGTLKSGSGEKVTDQKQAIAIALSEAGLSKDKGEGDQLEKARESVPTLMVTGSASGIETLAKIVEAIKDHGNGGHSYSIIIDADLSKEDGGHEVMGWDGDGSDYINKIEIIPATVNKGEEDKIHGGKADNMDLTDIAKHHGVYTAHIQKEYNKGLEIEKEHTDDPEKAAEIVKDHLMEFPDYYTRLEKMEKEAETEKGIKGKFERSLPEEDEFEKARNLGHLVPKKVPIKDKTGQIHYAIRWVNPETGESEKLSDISEKNRAPMKETLEETVAGIVGNEDMARANKMRNLVDLGIYDPKLLFLLSGDAGAMSYLKRMDIDVKSLPDNNDVVKKEIKKEQANNDTPEGRESNTIMRSVEDIDELWEDYEDNMRLVAEGGHGARFALAYGSGGVGKSYTFEKLAEQMELRRYNEEIQPSKDQYDYIMIGGGRITPVQVYAEMYRHNGKLLVFDDCDSFLMEENVEGFLKGGLNTGKDHTVSNRTGRPAYIIEGDKESGTIPNTFQFKGRVIAITNLSVKDISQPIFDRCLPSNLTMTIDETMRMLKKIKDKVTIYTEEGEVVPVKQEARDIAFEAIERHKTELGRKISSRTFYNATILVNRALSLGQSIERITRKLAQSFASRTGDFDEIMRSTK